MAVTFTIAYPRVDGVGERVLSLWESDKRDNSEYRWGKLVTRLSEIILTYPNEYPAWKKVSEVVIEEIKTIRENSEPVQQKLIDLIHLEAKIFSEVNNIDYVERVNDSTVGILKIIAEDNITSVLVH